MGSEKTGRGGALVTFGAAGEAGRRIAGVAAAARIARALAQAGHDRIWLAFPGGGPLPPHADEDVRRLAAGATVEVADSQALELAGIDPAELAELTIVAAPKLRAPDILKGTAKASDGPVSTWLNRPVSQRLSALLLLIPGIRPIHATFGTILIAAAMFAALVLGGSEGLVAGGLLFHAASVFDGVDGEIARATFRSSPAGAALDTAVDMATNLLFLLGVTFNLSLGVGLEAALVGSWGFLLFVAGVGIFYPLAARNEGPFTLDLIKHRYRGAVSGPVAAWLIDFLATVSGRDFFALLFALLILGGAPLGVLYIFASAATIWLLFIAAAVLARHPRPASEALD